MLERAPKDAGDVANEPKTRPVRFRGGGFTPAASRWAGWLSLAAALGVWQLTGSLALVNPLFLPTPLTIMRALYRLAASGALWQHVSVSFVRIVSGWALGT